MPALDGRVREVRAGRRFARLYNFASGTQAADGMLAAAASTLVMVRGVLPIVLKLRALACGRPQCSGCAHLEMVLSACRRAASMSRMRTNSRNAIAISTIMIGPPINSARVN